MKDNRFKMIQEEWKADLIGNHGLDENTAIIIAGEVAECILMAREDAYSDGFIKACTQIRNFAASLDATSAEDIL